MLNFIAAEEKTWTKTWFLLKNTEYNEQHVRNKEVLRRIGSIKKLATNNQKKQLEFLGQSMKKEGLESLMFTR